MAQIPSPIVVGQQRPDFLQQLLLALITQAPDFAFGMMQQQRLKQETEQKMLEQRGTEAAAQGGLAAAAATPGTVGRTATQALFGAGAIAPDRAQLGINAMLAAQPGTDLARVPAPRVDPSQLQAGAAAPLLAMIRQLSETQAGVGQAEAATAASEAATAASQAQTRLSGVQTEVARLERDFMDKTQKNRELAIQYQNEATLAGMANDTIRAKAATAQANAELRRVKISELQIAADIYNTQANQVGNLTTLYANTMQMTPQEARLQANADVFGTIKPPTMQQFLQQAKFDESGGFIPPTIGKPVDEYAREIGLDPGVQKISDEALRLSENDPNRAFALAQASSALKELPKEAQAELLTKIASYLTFVTRTKVEYKPPIKTRIFKGFNAPANLLRALPGSAQAPTMTPIEIIRALPGTAPAKQTPPR